MFDAFIRSLGDAIAQARERLISQGWFGQPELPDFTAMPDAGFEERMFPSPDFQRDLHDWLNPADASEPGGQRSDQGHEQQPDHGIDR